MENKEKSWMKALNLKPEDFSDCPEDQNPLLWAFESQLLKEDDYTQWASEAYELPQLNSEFFELGWDKTLKATFQNVFPWEKDCFPVYKWQDVIYVACLEPQQILVDAKVCFLIASPAAMMTAWETFESQNTNAVPVPEVQDIAPTAPALAEEEPAVAPHTSEIVAAHPDLEPSVLDFDLTALDVSVPPTPSIDEDSEPKQPDNKTEELTQAGDPRIPDDLTEEHTLIADAPPPPEPPNLESLDNLDFGALDFGAPPAPPEPTPTEAKAPETNSKKEDSMTPESPATASEAAPIPSLEDLDLSKISPAEAPPSAEVPPKNVPAPLDLDLEIPTLEPTPAPEAPILSKEPPAPPEMNTKAPEPPSLDLGDLAPPPPSPVPAETPAPPTVEAAPPPPSPSLETATPPVFDDDKTPPPQAAPSPTPLSSVPSDKSITLAHLQGGPDLENCESIPQIVEHIFLKIHKDFKKLMWIPKSRTKGYIPDLAMGPWATKEETWTTPVNIRNANIFRVAWSSKLPFHGPVSSNTTNDKYFAMWDAGNTPAHITIFPMCSEAKKCLGFVVGCGKGPEFDSKKTLRRFEQIMELTAKQLSSTALDKAA